jgi:glycosyltransferase involved in cell wall biosynthesis
MADVTLPVSVIIPTFNSAKTISRALESVARQTLPPAEIIIVDDCSTDLTISIVEDFARDSQQIVRILTRSKNDGPSTTRNYGWDSAKFDYIAFLDSDDSWHPNKLEIQTKWMIKNSHCVVSGHLTSRDVEKINQSNFETKHFGLFRLLVRNRVSTPTVMVKRLLPSRFDQSMRYAEDYDLWLRLVALHGSLTRIELPLAQLHKADFGESGLSSHLIPMFLGERFAVKKLRRSKQIALIPTWIALVWMSIKFSIRLARVKIVRHA